MRIEKTVMGLMGMLCVSQALTAELSPVPLGSDLIYFKGANYVYRDEGAVAPLRFRRDVLGLSPEQLNFNPAIARWSSGIKLVFSTSSSAVRIDLVLRGFRSSEPATCRIYRDGKAFRDFKWTRLQEDSPVEIQLENPDAVGHLYCIEFPATAETVVTGMFLAEGFGLDSVALDKKPVYVALGDSITHGSGNLNGVSADAYSYLLGQKLGCDFFNLGVSGGRVAPKIGEMLADWKQVDLITVLLGANDFSWAAVPPERYRQTYGELIAAIRESHPLVPLFCITLTYTTREAGDTGDLTETYRQVVRDIVQSARAKGDDHIFLVEGDELTGPHDLYDWVHLTADGNRRFAEKLYREIQETTEF